MMRAFVGCMVFAGCTVLAAQSAWQRPFIYPGDLSDRSGPSDASASSSDAPIARAVLDSHVLATARFDLADLRVEKLPRPGSTDSIQSIGFQVSPATQRRRQCAHEFVAVERLGTRIFGDTAFEAIYAVSDSTAPTPTRIALGLDARDFEVSLTVATAPLPPDFKVGASTPPAWHLLDGLAWKTRLSEEALYDYARIADVRREQADWDKSSDEGDQRRTSDRLLRIRVSGLTQTQRSALTTLTGALGRPERETYAVHARLVRIESIRFSGEVCRELAIHALVDTLTLIDAPLPVPPLSTLRDPATPYTWTPFVAGGLPLRALHFRVGSRHFLRSAVVTGWPEKPGPRDGDSLKPWTWPQLGQGELQRIDWGKGGGRSVDSALRIPVSMTRRMRYLALGTLDRDDAPIRFVGVRGEVSRLNLEFAVELEPAAEIAYRLRYAGPESTAFASDFSALLRRAPDSLRREMRLGQPEIMKVAAPSNRQPWLTGQTLFTLGLGVGIAVLVGFLLLAVRQARPERSREKSHE